MTQLRVLTVDDEVLALRRLRLLLNTIGQAQHVGEASSCGEALTMVDSLAPDVVLLDIKMRDGSGFEVVEALARRPNPPVVILVTAFDHFAVRAFETSVTDYLMKPVERERLARALAKAADELRALDAEQRLSDLQQVVRNLRSAAHPNGSGFESEFWLRGATGLIHVPVDAIDCVSSEDEYVAIHTTRGSQLMRSSLRKFENRVEPGLFVRVHRRWLVRRSAITEIRTAGLGRVEVVLRNGKRLPAGRVYLKQLKQVLHAGNTPGKEQPPDG